MQTKKWASNCPQFFNYSFFAGTAYDNFDRQQQRTAPFGAKSSTILSRTDYLYDKNGNRSKETINRNAAAQVTNYRYDNADRLTQTELVDVNQTVTTDYTLDAVANRIKEIVTTKPAGSASASTQTKTYTYDGRNQLTAITDSVAGNTDLSYDSQGNLLQKSKGSDITAYSYNARDNLISVRQNSTVLGNYRNDHLGLRVEKEAKDPLQPNAPPVTLRTLWNGRHAFQDSDTSGNTLSRYENDGRHTVSFWSNTDGSQALHHDALGSIVATTDTAGQLKSETIYDAFGNISSQSGQSANKFGYTGHQMDKESGLIYFQARYYDPQTGRFLTQDPYEGDWNTPLSLHHYLYAYGNPTVYVDLHGYESVSTMIDNAASGCGAISCAGWALLKGAYTVGTLGFSSVHDPMRDAYDEGKITGKQYVGYGIGGGAAVVAANVITGRVGGSLIASAGTLSKQIATSAGVGAVSGGITDGIAQGANIGADLQESYDVGQTATASAVGAAFGGAISTVAAGLKTEVGQAITGAISSTVRKTRDAVEKAAQSVSSRIKGAVTQEASTMGTAGAKITGKTVVAEPTRRMPVGDEPFAGANGMADGGMPHPVAASSTALESQLADAVGARAESLATKGASGYLSRSQRGPVLTGVMDPQTGEIFYGLNQGKIPTNLHPIVQKRLDAYLEATGGVTPPRAGIPGSHSEISALDQAIRARELLTGVPVVESDLSSFFLHNRALIGERRVIGIPPRCANCAAITNGVKIIGGN